MLHHRDTRVSRARGDVRTPCTPVGTRPRPSITPDGADKRLDHQPSLPLPIHSLNEVQLLFINDSLLLI